MLSGWHLPVSPFVRLADDALHITLWLQGDSLPAQVFLRCEPDNEEWLLTMEGHESHDRWRYSVSLPLYEGQPTRRYCFKLLWDDRQQWFGPLGFSVIPPAQLAQFAVDVPDSGPDWVADQVFIRSSPIALPVVRQIMVCRRGVIFIMRPVARYLAAVAAAIG